MEERTYTLNEIRLALIKAEDKDCCERNKKETVDPYSNFLLMIHTAVLIKNVEEILEGAPKEEEMQ